MRFKKFLLVTFTSFLVGGIFQTFSNLNEVSTLATTRTIIAPSNIRIWFAPETNWRQGNASFRIQKEVGGQTYNFVSDWYNSQETEFGTSEWKRYVYFDVPKVDFPNNTSFRFTRHNPGYSELWNTGKYQTYNTNNNTQVYNYPSNCWNDCEAGLGRPGRVDSGLAVTALAGYLTCKEDSENGHTLFNEVVHTWIDGTLDRWDSYSKVEGFLSSHTIVDYNGTGASLYNSARIDASTNGFQKYQRLQFEYRF